MIRSSIKSAYDFCRHNPNPRPEQIAAHSGLMVDLQMFTQSGNKHGLYWNILGGPKQSEMVVEIICGNPADPQPQILATKESEGSKNDTEWVMAHACEWIRNAITDEIRFELKLPRSKQSDDPWAETVEEVSDDELIGRILDL